jgi:hypothetical protein
VTWRSATRPSGPGPAWRAIEADVWLCEIVSEDGAVLDLPQLGISVPLHEVYANAGLPRDRQA